MKTVVSPKIYSSATLNSVSFKFTFPRPVNEFHDILYPIFSYFFEEYKDIHLKRLFTIEPDGNEYSYYVLVRDLGNEKVGGILLINGREVEITVAGKYLGDMLKALRLI